MNTRLIPLTPTQFHHWLSQSKTDYKVDLIKTGLTPKVAERQSEVSLSSAFPTGAPTAENAVFSIANEADAQIGYVWVGRDTSDDPASWWVWDIVVNPAFRGRGFGRAGMELAEAYARSRGAETLGLSVFGFNTAAHGLYESLGYETTSIKMRKNLSAG